MKTDITDFDSYEVAGFDIAGWRQKDGSVKFENRTIPRFPKEITCNGVAYALEEVREYERKHGEMFCNAMYA